MAKHTVYGKLHKLVTPNEVLYITPINIENEKRFVVVNGKSACVTKIKDFNDYIKQYPHYELIKIDDVCEVIQVTSKLGEDSFNLILPCLNYINVSQGEIRGREFYVTINNNLVLHYSLKENSIYNVTRYDVSSGKYTSYESIIQHSIDSEVNQIKSKIYRGKLIPKTIEVKDFKDSEIADALSSTFKDHSDFYNEIHKKKIKSYEDLYQSILTYHSMLNDCFRKMNDEYDYCIPPLKTYERFMAFIDGISYYDKFIKVEDFLNCSVVEEPQFKLHIMGKF